VGDGAVAAALGGRAGELPGVYRASSPAARLPIGLPVAVVLTHDDDPHLVAMGRSFAAAARAAGDDVVLLEGEGDHFALIDPGAPIWSRVVTLAASRTSPAAGAPPGQDRPRAAR
jgi:hypothetical protein